MVFWQFRRRHAWRCMVLLGLGMAHLWLSAPAQANPVEDQMGLFPAMQAMGGAGTALSTDASAIYYNPASLALCARPRVNVGYTYTAYNLGTYDADNSDAAAVHTLRGRHGLVLAGCMPLPFGFHIGGLFGVNPQHPQTLHQDTLGGEPQFVLYGRRFEQMSIMGALSYTIIPGLSIGAGGSGLVNSNLYLTNTIPITGSERLASTYDWDMKAHASLYAGIHYQPIPQVRFAATYRGPMYHHLDAKARSQASAVGTTFDVNLKIQADMWWAPRQVAIGATYQEKLNANWDIVATADVTWYQWSNYPGPFIRVEPDGVEGIATTLNYAPAMTQNFRDIYVPRTGVQFRYKNAWAGRMGYGYYPTPAPVPKGETNLLDNTAHGISVGGGHTIALPIFRGKDQSRKPMVLHTDFYVMTLVMQSRSVHKAEGVANLPLSYKYGGQVYSFGLQFSVDL